MTLQQIPVRLKEKTMAKRAQITVETLLVFLISLSLVLIALATVNIIDKTQKKAAYSGLLNMQADQIVEFANQACILGEGNYYTLSLSNIGLSITQKDEKTLVFESGSLREEREFICPIKLQQSGKYGSKLYLWYEEQKIVISPNP
ncbi:MAG: hypothetical protein N3D10_01740 [Candidatus Micrarchaeota archaeon]|nr:hypothetical protein [Candidatus Micrarchaeota archaeon]